MPDTNLVRSLTYLMDCFLDEYRDVKVAKDIGELDLRAQLEVRLECVSNRNNNNNNNNNNDDPYDIFIDQS